ncbi:MAG: ATP synthase F1 subunit delta [Chloroflexi bacterium]|nr:ATP synthase F1 subunit delta [Chloroflexota bacterium]|tara:strand:+ start:225 stop:758 length:534 start_codon:yes stop_codon:yes gene_type:complete
MISPQRYAKALFEIAIEKSLINEWLKQINNISLILDNEDVIVLLDSPQVPENVKFDGIETLFSDIDLLVKNLIFLMTRNRDITKFNLFKDIFNDLVDKHFEITRVQVKTANQIPTNQIEKLKESLLEFVEGSTVEISQIVDENILGGIIIRIGDKVIDASSKTKINNMKDFLLKGAA